MSSPTRQLDGVERHGLEPVAAFDPVVVPFEGDARVVEGDEPGIGNRDAMGLAGEIGENGLGSGEVSLGVDDPLGPARSGEDGVEGALVGEQSEIAEEPEAASLVQGGDAFEKQATKEARQHAHRQEEAELAGDPARPVRGQAAAGNDDVDMRMMGQRRAPGVEHSGEADARAQMLRVGGDGVSVSAAVLNNRS